jgi:V/A-type H+-transporting ATPase subunit D
VTLRPRIPPGRAGRIWLRHRVDTAQRGRDQLDRKLRILLPERERLAAQAARLDAEWSAACDEAGPWLLRAAMLGGQDVLRIAAAPRPFEVEVTWTTTMGLSYPADASPTDLPAGKETYTGGAAVVTAAAEFRSALLAGVRTAAAQEAVRRVDAEIASLRRRIRALEKRWLPWLSDALHGLELTLEQAEQEDGSRLRRAVALQAPQASPAGRTSPPIGHDPG